MRTQFSFSLRFAWVLTLALLGTVAVASPAPLITPESVDPTAEAITIIRQEFDFKIRPLVNRACVACHDSHARPEGFFGAIPGIRGSEWKHIRLASKIMDFSRTFPDWSAQSSSPVFFLDQIRAVLQKGTMPLAVFRFAHALDGRLLKSWENQVIIDWTLDSERLLAQADVSRPTALKILQNRCLGCHSEDVEAGGLVLTVSDGQLVVPRKNSSKGMPYLTPGSPENSALFEVLLTDSSARGGLPQMPKNGDPLSDQDRAVVYDWIKQQAP